MNKCIISGKILEDIDFKFIYNSKAISIAMCVLQLIDKTQIKIYGLDEKADYMYRKLHKNDVVIVFGSLMQNKAELKIEVEEIEKW